MNTGNNFKRSQLYGIRGNSPTTGDLGPIPRAFLNRLSHSKSSAAVCSQPSASPYRIKRASFWGKLFGVLAGKPVQPRREYLLGGRIRIFLRSFSSGIRLWHEYNNRPDSLGITVLLISYTKIVRWGSVEIVRCGALMILALES